LFTALFHKLFKAREIVPVKAYNRWARSYDNQPHNLMLPMDDALFLSFLDTVNLKNKNILDVGCGTGRLWKKIMQKEPRQLVGYDVSTAMLAQLKAKFPGAIIYLSSGNRLNHTADNTVDVLISTLTIAHIKDAEAALSEWNRVLQHGADIYFSDYHPAILGKGGKRTFADGDKTISIKNYIHTIEKIQSIASKLNWKPVKLTEKKIDETVKNFYEKQGALDVYEKYKGLPVIYGIHFKK
jgi:ubiquinone/menaquinone biosynthesis C-methylase UbiE